MSEGLLRKCFDGVVAKRLSAVEADTNRSNQHEFNGTNILKKLLGTEEPKTFEALFVWLGEEQEGITEEGFVTWYDARRDHPTRSEYRLYFKGTAVSSMVSESDPVFIATRPDGTLMVIATKAFSTMENQLIWLFGLEDLPDPKNPGAGTLFAEGRITEHSEHTDFAIRYILEELGLEPEEPETDYIDLMLSRFGKTFPTTDIFSSFARETIQGIDPVSDPDDALLAWINHEEHLFRRLERHIVEDRLEKGFYDEGEADVDGFLKFSLSVQNRRKSRAGLALENHLAEIFIHTKIQYARGVLTEDRSKPDFLFPGQEEYHDMGFSSERLTMLGSKSTCKDRWRQVLTEARRIRTKHLLTLEPGISENQTQEMQRESLQLVLPKALHKTFKPDQQEWLMSLSEFIESVRLKQIN
jgi:hypothetical protein